MLKTILIILVDKTTKNMGAEDKIPETLEEAQELLKVEREAKVKATERAIGAEKVIEEHKKKDKDKDPIPKEDPKPQFGDADMKRILDERDFYNANPDMTEYKEKLSVYTSKGISLNDAKVLLERNDETIANRKNAKKMDFSTGKPLLQSKTMSREEFSKLSPPEFKKVVEMEKKGEVEII